jgi:hypothetical protein
LLVELEGFVMFLTRKKLIETFKLKFGISSLTTISKTWLDILRLDVEVVSLLLALKKAIQTFEVDFGIASISITLGIIFKIWNAEI